MGRLRCAQSELENIKRERAKACASYYIYVSVVYVILPRCQKHLDSESTHNEDKYVQGTWGVFAAWKLLSSDEKIESQ